MRVGEWDFWCVLTFLNHSQPSKQTLSFTTVLSGRMFHERSVGRLSDVPLQSNIRNTSTYLIVLKRYEVRLLSQWNYWFVLQWYTPSYVPVTDCDTGLGTDWSYWLRSSRCPLFIGPVGGLTQERLNLCVVTWTWVTRDFTKRHRGLLVRRGPSIPRRSFEDTFYVFVCFFFLEKIYRRSRSIRKKDKYTFWAINIKLPKRSTTLHM